jgi:hypothetical protein
MTGYGGMKNCVKDYGEEVPFMYGRRTFAVCYNSLDVFIVTISLHAFVEKSYYILITSTWFARLFIHPVTTPTMSYMYFDS